MGGDAEADGSSGDVDLVELREFGAGPGEADLEAFDFSEPSLASGFVDSGDQVVADLEEAVPLGGVRP